VHTWDSGKITTKATCTTEGIRTFTCLVCKEPKEEIIPIDEKAHSWDKGEVTQEGDCTHPQITTFTCDECGKTKTETAKVNGHKYTTKETPATLTSRGYTTYTCSVCKDTYDGNYKWYVPEESVASSTTGIRNQNGLKEGSSFSATSAYTWKGGEGRNFAKTGVGAVAFAYTCSDAMFGIDPAYRVEGSTNLKAGDIVFVSNGDCYFVQAISGTNVYVAGVSAVGSNLIVKWDQVIPLNSISYHLSRWYKY